MHLMLVTLNVNSIESIANELWPVERFSTAKSTVNYGIRSDMGDESVMFVERIGS